MIQRGNNQEKIFENRIKMLNTKLSRKKDVKKLTKYFFQIDLFTFEKKRRFTFI